MPINLDSISNLSPEFQKAFQASFNADRKPIQQLEEKKAKIQEKATLLEDLSGRLEGIRKIIPNVSSGIAIRELSLNSDDPKAISGTADKSIAEPGKHSLEILQLAGSASALSNGFSDKDTTRIGTGYLVFNTADGDTKEVFIDYENSTLEQIAQSINKARTGMKATVITDSQEGETAYKLMFFNDGTGKKADVSFPEFYFAGGEDDFFLETERDATNAIVKYQGYQIELSSNEANDLIPGASLNLKGVTDPGKPTTVTIEQDVPKTLLKVKDLVEQLNSTFSFLQQNQTQVGDKPPMNKPLSNEYSIRMAENRLREALRENFLFEEDSPRAIKSLNDVGIQFQKNGTLAFDEKKLEHALTTRFDETVDLLAGDGVNYGVVTKLNQALSTLSSSGFGLIANQRQTFSNQSSALERQIEQKEKQADTRAEALKIKLAKAQSALQAMQSQGSFFGGGGAMPGAGG